MSPNSVAWVAPAVAVRNNVKTRQHASRLFSAHSQRGLNAVSLLPTYLADARAVERYSPSTPDGALQLGVAENQMLQDLLMPALNEFGSSHDVAADCIYYQPTHGRLATRNAMAEYLQRTLKLSSLLDPEGLVLGAGCNAVLENLCVCLAEAGQAVMIPTPYYAAFEFDLVARAGLEILPVNTLDHATVDIPSVDNVDETIPMAAYYPTRAALEHAYQRAIDNGQEPRILLLSHPNNPLGICYPQRVVKDCIDWCREREVHLVSDEIYAGSVYRDSSSNAFTSTLELAGGIGNLGPYIHLVYALSKDFALSGLRVGVSYSENKDIRLPLQKLNDLCQISSQTQVLVENMLSSKSDDGNNMWTDAFLKQSHARLQARGDALQECLTDCGIPHLPADSGLFCWMDFSEFLPELDPAAIGMDGKEELESMEARERTLYLELMKEFGLLFTPGMSMRNERPGFFRCVFTAATDEEFSLSLDRINKFVAAKRAS